MNSSIYFRPHRIRKPLPPIPILNISSSKELPQTQPLPFRPTIPSNPVQVSYLPLPDERAPTPRFLLSLPTPPLFSPSKKFALKVGSSGRLEGDIGSYDGGLEELDDEEEQEEVVESRGVFEVEARSSEPKAAKQWSLKSFERGHVLGSGAFGKVYLARTRSSPNYIVALKALKKQRLVNTEMEVQFRREIEIQSQLRHPNILRLYGFFQTRKHVTLILEFAGKGELFDYLQKKGPFPDSKSSRYIAQVAQGLSYLHTKHVIHRDIKPENLLIGVDGQLKIADFGWSVHAPSDRRKTICGTTEYMAPELLPLNPKSASYYSHRADIWSLGILAFEFLTKRAPFATSANYSGGASDFQIGLAEKKATEETKKKIREGNIATRLSGTKLQVDARDLIMKLVRVNPEERIALQDLFRHPWITAYNPNFEMDYAPSSWSKDL